ncbi:Unconventional myosin-XVIIIa [Liparis tanakae]|uniref:Unconventional myosin-XVIIIa n=1 Tax=Liparis tanakae TaxID=230148 RepID=A0A4Z2JAM7_9TELE|nr:Unconventional myosin-XVIIIa [Liparis tanakae]
MFHLIKKDKEKDLDKKEKKEKKERMSQAELKSLEEMSIRRGFFNLNRGSSKRDLRSKLEISSPIPIKVATNMELSLMDLKVERQDVGQISASISGEDMRGKELDRHGRSVKERAAKFGELARVNSVVGQKHVSFSQKVNRDDTSEASDLAGENSTTYFKSHSSPKGTYAVDIPELVEKTFPGADLQLPVLVAPPIPNPRELELQRRNTGDFGFSLRRTTMLDRLPDGGVCRRVVHFAEPCAGTKDRALGLVPGDRLVEINGINVENKSRDEIVEMIRQSGETVRLKVQPILELSELNSRWLRTTEGPHRDVLDSFDTKQWDAEENNGPNAATDHGHMVLIQHHSNLSLTVMGPCLRCAAHYTRQTQQLSLFHLLSRYAPCAPPHTTAVLCWADCDPAVDAALPLPQD